MIHVQILRMSWSQETSPHERCLCIVQATTACLNRNITQLFRGLLCGREASKSHATIHTPLSRYAPNVHLFGGIALALRVEALILFIPRAHCASRKRLATFTYLTSPKLCELVDVQCRLVIMEHFEMDLSRKQTCTLPSIPESDDAKLVWTVRGGRG